MKILLVEDEERIAGFVRAGLREFGWAVEHCGDGEDGFNRACESVFDVIVLDIMLPGRDGLSVLKALRQRGDNTPVILLTARNELQDRVVGLDHGADDYLAKPFYVDELMARIRAVARRVGGAKQNILAVGDLRLDRLTREASWQGETVELTRREFNLLEFLMRAPGRVRTRTQILEQVWEYDFDPNTNLIDACVQRLRRKLPEPQNGVSPIESIRGVGYRLRRPEPTGS